MAAKKKQAKVKAKAPAKAAKAKAPVKAMSAPVKTKAAKAAPVASPAKAPEPASPPAEAAPKPPAKKKSDKPKPFAGKRFAFFGEFTVWPRYHHTSPSELARRRGASLVADLDESVNVVVFGDHKGTGRADAKKKAERLVANGAKLEILDEAQYRELVRIDLKGKSFAFVGGFDCSPEGTGMLEAMASTAGGTTAEVGPELDYLVVGNRRGPSKIALINKATAPR